MQALELNKKERECLLNLRNETIYLQGQYFYLFIYLYLLNLSGFEKQHFAESDEVYISVCLSYIVCVYMVGYYCCLIYKITYYKSQLQKSLYIQWNKTSEVSISMFIVLHPLQSSDLQSKYRLSSGHKKLRSIDPLQYSDEWLLRNRWCCTQSKTCLPV